MCIRDSLDPVPLGGGRTATAVSTGAFHACAVLDNGAVKCWGYNSNGPVSYTHLDVYKRQGPKRVPPSRPRR